jgi:DNA polymerase
MAEAKREATRHDIMVELGLAPVWVRRGTLAVKDEQPPEVDAPRSGQRDGTPTADHLSPSSNLRGSGAPTSTQPTSDPPASPEERERRIARISMLDFAALEADVAQCTACALCRTRKRTVPGVGDRNANWLFVGEAPGAEEDARGEPFVGQAGKLLDNMLAALAMSRQDNVYIANVLKCRPPNNRTPEPGEAAACRPYLERQVALLKPQLIVALGRSAAVQLLNMDAPIASLRGKVHHYGDIPLIVTYHPAYLLRNLPDKAKAWEDLLLARRTVAAATEVA